LYPECSCTSRCPIYLFQYHEHSGYNPIRYRYKIIDDGQGRREALGIRRMIERKFGEAKKWHGMARARYRGLAKVKIQVLMTFLAINVKKLARLLEQKGHQPSEQLSYVPT
jgi:hypothetical protein